MCELSWDPPWPRVAPRVVPPQCRLSKIECKEHRVPALAPIYWLSLSLCFPIGTKDLFGDLS